MKHCYCGLGCYCNLHRIGRFQVRGSAYWRSERSRPPSSLPRKKSVTSPMASRWRKEDQHSASYLRRPLPFPPHPHYFIARRHFLRIPLHCFTNFTLHLHQPLCYLRNPIAEPPVTWSPLSPNLIVALNCSQLSHPGYCSPHRRSILSRRCRSR